MFRKSLLMTAALCIMTASMAMAADYSHTRQAPSASAAGKQSYGVCVRGSAGSGQVLNWVKNEMQCRTSTNADMWVENGIVKNTYQRGN